MSQATICKETEQDFFFSFLFQGFLFSRKRKEKLSESCAFDQALLPLRIYWGFGIFKRWTKERETFIGKAVNFSSTA